jgi:hypothetical protein
MGLFCGCFQRRPSADPSYPKPSYARIVEAKKCPPPYSSLPIDIATTVSCRRRSRERTDAANEGARLLPSSQLIDIDEKEALETSVDSSAASSARSSTISLPSSRVTALTVTTDHTGASNRSRRSHDSAATTTRGAPPSYSSRRSATHQRWSNRSSWDHHHPVQAEDWFDQFREP